MPTDKTTESLRVLEELAASSSSSGVSQYSSLDKDLTKQTEQINIERSNNIIRNAQEVYGEDSSKIFEVWQMQTLDFDLKGSAKDYYWKTYENLYGDKDIARQSINDSISFRLKNFGSTGEKEYYLREALSNSPDWLQEKYNPVLSSLMAINQTKDVEKLRLIYQKNINDNVKTIASGGDLDPGISEDNHLKDFEKAETMGLLPGSSIIDGRLSVTNKTGKTQPIWSVNNVSEVFDDAPNITPSPFESSFYRNSVRNNIRDYVSTNVQQSRFKVGEQNKLLKSSVLYEVRQGNIPIDEWGNMAALVEDTTENPTVSVMFLLLEGIKGQMDKDPDMPEDDVVNLVLTVANQYRYLLEGDNDASTT